MLFLSTGHWALGTPKSEYIVVSTLDEDVNMSWSPLGHGGPQSEGGMPMPGGPRPWSRSCWWGSGHGCRSLWGQPCLFPHTHSDTAHVPVICFCLLNPAVLRAPRQPKLQLLSHPVTIRKHVAVTQGHRGAWHVGFSGLLPPRQPLPRTVNPLRRFVIMNERTALKFPGSADFGICYM